MAVTRREFGAASTASLIVSRHVLGGPKYKAPGEKLNLAGIGIGGMGASYLAALETENIVALCDVDQVLAAKTFAKYPAAKTYRDYRVLLDREKEIDGVVIGTPDHTHAAIALAAMQLGKHLYCAKPMTRTIADARRLAAAAREAGLATQMSVQSSMSDGACTVAEWIQAGAAGPVREVHVWSDRPVWPHAITRPVETPPVPESLDWSLWLGAAPPRPYHPLYHPFNWRGWYDFGTGALGDMGCHTLHVIFRALDLGHASGVHATSAFLMQPASSDKADQPWMRARKAKFDETFPAASIVTWEFPARRGMPPVRVTWYDGGLKPPRPLGLDATVPLGPSGLYFAGEKGTLLSGFSGSVNPRLLPAGRQKDFAPPPKTLPRTSGHYQEWVTAAKGGKPASCNFDFGGLLTETALLGTLAIRTGRNLTWDAAALRTSDAEANSLIGA